MHTQKNCIVQYVLSIHDTNNLCQDSLTYDEPFLTLGVPF